MQWEFILALVVAIPIVLLPVVLIWYLGGGGIYTAVKEALGKRVTHKKSVKEMAKHGQ